MFFDFYSCAVGYYGYPDCIPCDCDVNGTVRDVCQVGYQCLSIFTVAQLVTMATQTVYHVTVM